LEEAYLESLLEGADTPKDGRVIDAERARRSGQRAGACHGEEEPQVVPVRELCLHAIPPLNPCPIVEQQFSARPRCDASTPAGRHFPATPSCPARAGLGLCV